MNNMFPNGYNVVNHLTLNDLLQKHSVLLSAKEINNTNELLTVLCCDFEKILHALLEIQLVNVDQILADFFSEHPQSVPDILSNITEHELNHVGFEICQPLNIVIENLAIYLNQLSDILGKSVILNRQLRFPASNAFRQRVGAITEILCLWLEIEGREVMIELFDIARSIHGVLPNTISPLSVINNADIDTTKQHNAMNYLFENDKIWHYSIDVINRQTVLQLHHAFEELTIEQTHYKLAYNAPIQNQYDFSFHTKIINTARHLELEFVTRGN